MLSLIVSSFFLTGALAQGEAWSQCGGKGWTGATTCVSGFTCSVASEYYSQCVPGTAASTTLQTSTTKPASPTKPTATATASAAPSGTGFKWFGVDESVAEFGTNKYPGVYGKDFYFPSNTSIQTLIGEGFNIFRVPFAMERMLSGQTLTSPLAEAYLANYTGTINYITSAGAYAALDPHNYGRLYGNIITDTAGFKTFWANLAGHFKDNPKVIFDTNNEFHDEDQNLVLQMNQAAIDGIRGAGAKSQYLFIEGNSYTGAWTWQNVNSNLASLTDPENKIVYEMHQYLDSDGSGTSPDCVSTTIGKERVTSATEWLKTNKKLGVLGEFAGGANDQCKTAITGLLDYLEDNSDVWLGALWWAGGPWWADYIYSFEPPTGPAYQYYDTLLRKYVPK